MINNTFSGIATPFTGNGRKLGYPTANIDAPPEVDQGVYAGMVSGLGKELPAMIFIGAPITLEDDRRRAEANILDFEDRDLYGEHLDFTLLKKIRGNKQFEDMDQLITAISQDESEIRAFFASQELSS